MKVSVVMVNKLVDDIESLIMSRLEAMLESKNEVLDNANAVEYPRAARIEALEAQINILQSAYEDLENVVSNLQEYE